MAQMAPTQRHRKRPGERIAAFLCLHRRDGAPAKTSVPLVSRRTGPTNPKTLQTVTRDILLVDNAIALILVMLRVEAHGIGMDHGTWDGNLITSPSPSALLSECQPHAPTPLSSRLSGQ